MFVHTSFQAETAVLMHNRYLKEAEPISQSMTGTSAYRVYDTLDNQFRILKSPAQNTLTLPEYHAKIEAEACVLALLNHPGIPKLIDVFLQDGPAIFPVMVVQEMEGLSLTRRMGTFNRDEIKKLTGELASVLDYAHDPFGVSQGDVWHENVRVGTGHAGLIDFGNSNFAPSETVETTPFFSAPELYTSRSATQFSDIYSLAATVYSAIVSRPPFRVIPQDGQVDADPQNREYRPLTEKDVRKYGVGDASLTQLNHLFERAFDTEPVHRFSTAGDFNDAFQNVF